MAEELEDNPNEKLKKRALDAYKKYKPNMDILANERVESSEYYYGEPRGDEVKGRSKVISRDLFEIVESQMPSFMRIFYGGQRVVEVTPQGADDEEKAKLMEEKINYDFQKLNNGFKILYQFFKDALLHKIGVVSYSWDRTPKWKYWDYTENGGITESTIQDLENGIVTDINPKGHTHIIDEKILIKEGGLSAEGIPFESTYSVKCREKIKQSRPKFVNRKPEDVTFNIDMTDVEDLEGFISIRSRIHKRKLKEYEFDEKEIEGMVDKYDATAEIQARFADIGGLSFITDEKDSDFVYLHQCFMYDFDEEGNPIPKIVNIIGDKVGKVEVNKYGRPPVCIITPTIISHRLVGMSTFDGAKDIQDISTGFLRIMLDSGFYQNSPVTIWNPMRVETIPEERFPGLKVIMSSDGDPSTVMYTEKPTPLAPQIPDIYKNVMPKIKGRRFGISDFSQGLDPKALATRTSGGISQLLTSSQEPKELIARCFAETGVRDMFLADMNMNIDFYDVETNIKINDKWATITRNSINGLFDISIDVGVGTGSKDMIFNQLINMLNTYGGIANAIKDPQAILQVFNFENVRNILEAAWEMLGFKNAKGRFTANERTGIINPANPTGTAIQRVPAEQGVPGGGGGGMEENYRNMAAMPY